MERSTAIRLDYGDHHYKVIFHPNETIVVRVYVPANPKSRRFSHWRDLNPRSLKAFDVAQAARKIKAAS